MPVVTPSASRDGKAVSTSQIARRTPSNSERQKGWPGAIAVHALKSFARRKQHKSALKAAISESEKRCGPSDPATGFGNVCEQRRRRSPCEKRDNHLSRRGRRKSEVRGTDQSPFERQPPPSLTDTSLFCNEVHGSKSSCAAVKVKLPPHASTDSEGTLVARSEGLRRKRRPPRASERAETRTTHRAGLSETAGAQSAERRLLDSEHGSLCGPANNQSTKPRTTENVL